MSGARLSALHLAGINENDRRWLLARLGPAERSAIVKHLGAALRMSPSHLSEVLGELSDANAAVGSRSSLAQPNDLSEVAVSTLHPFLDRLPLSAVAATASHTQNSWGRRYLDSKEPLTRRRYDQLASTTKNRVTSAFLERIEASISSHMGAETTPESSFEKVMRRTPNSDALG